VQRNTQYIFRRDTMKKEVKRLPDAHLQAAKDMLPKHRKKKNCKKCYDRGYIGTTDDNMLVPCTQCVDGDALLKEWKEYVKKFPELVELYGDSLEDKPEAAEGADAKKAKSAVLPGSRGFVAKAATQHPSSSTHIRRGAI